MAVKDDFKGYLDKRLGTAVSPTFTKRIHAVIDESSEDKESMTKAADRIGKMVRLFIDQKLSEEIYGSLIKLLR